MITFNEFITEGIKIDLSKHDFASIQSLVKTIILSKDYSELIRISKMKLPDDYEDVVKGIITTMMVNKMSVSKEDRPTFDDLLDKFNKMF